MSSSRISTFFAMDVFVVLTLPDQVLIAFEIQSIVLLRQALIHLRCQMKLREGINFFPELNQFATDSGPGVIWATVKFSRREF